MPAGFRPHRSLPGRIEYVAPDGSAAEVSPTEAMRLGADLRTLAGLLRGPGAQPRLGGPGASDPMADAGGGAPTMSRPMHDVNPAEVMSDASAPMSVDPEGLMPDRDYGGEPPAGGPAADGTAYGSLRLLETPEGNVVVPPGLQGQAQFQLGGGGGGPRTTATSEITRRAAVPDEILNAQDDAEVETRLALQELADNEAGAHRAVGDMYRGLGKEMEREDEIDREAVQRAQAEVRQTMARHQKLVDETGRMQSDPGAFFANRNTLGVVGAAVALSTRGLGQMISGRQGPPPLIDQLIEQEIRAQEANMLHARAGVEASDSLLGRMRQIHGDEAAARAGVREALLDRYRVAAEELAARQRGTSVEDQARLLAAQLAEQQLALRAEQEQRQTEVRIQQVVRSGGGGRRPVRVTLTAPGPGEGGAPNMEPPAGGVVANPRLWARFQGDPTAQRELARRYSQAQVFQRSIRDLRGLVGSFPTEAGQARAAALQALTTLEAAARTGQGALQAQDREQFAHILPPMGFGEQSIAWVLDEMAQGRMVARLDAAEQYVAASMQSDYEAVGASLAPDNPLAGAAGRLGAMTPEGSGNLDRLRRAGRGEPEPSPPPAVRPRRRQESVDRDTAAAPVPDPSGISGLGRRGRFQE